MDLLMGLPDNEWYTPARYVDAAREVMGGIDLDPASCQEANQEVQAAHYYTMQENGLDQPWYGRVWLNPPYNPTDGPRFPQPAWSRKLRREYQIGNVDQAVLLVSAAINKKWLHELFDYPVCLMLERIKFVRPGKAPEELRYGNIVIYLGPHEQKFSEVFHPFGRVMKAIDGPKSVPLYRELWTA